MLTAPITTEAFAEPALQSRLRVHLPGDPERADVEAFIAATYARHFGARLTVFAPNLVSIREGDAIVAAAGFRVATEALFLERAKLAEDQRVRVALGWARCVEASQDIDAAAHMLGRERELLRSLEARKRLDSAVARMFEERALFARAADAYEGIY